MTDELDYWDANRDEDLFSLIETLLDHNKWPTYTNSSVQSSLGQAADEAFQRDTFDGYLSYVLISHQVLEDYAVLLLREIQFALRLNVVPEGFGWPTAKYEMSGVRENAMFGRILQLIENSLEFNQKGEFLNACRKQGKIRNRLAHRLIEGLSLEQIRDLAHEYKRGEREVINTFNDADDQFSWFFTMQILNTRWLDAILEQINSAPGDAYREKWKTLLHRFYEAFEQEWSMRPDAWQRNNELAIRRWHETHRTLTWKG